MIRYDSHVSEVEPRHLRGFFVGWPKHPSAEALLSVLGRASHAVLAWEDDQVVGFVYAVSDGGLAAYIPLLEVRPEYQGQGIGTALVQQLLALLDDHYMIDVVCDDATAPFYERLGLVRLVGLARRNREAPVLDQ